MIAKKLLAGLLGTLALGHAAAHQIWIEPAGKAYTLHFGEYDENLKEVSPGLLDKMPTPHVVSVSGSKETPLAVSKGKEGFGLDAGLGKVAAIVAEVRSYPVFERKNGEQLVRGKWVPAARYVSDFSAQKPLNILDIVPNGAPGKFKLFFRGQALPKTKLTLIAPNGWHKPLQSDDNGEFEAATLWRGDHVIEASYKETTAGEIGGDKYDNASFTSTLTFTQTTGTATPRPTPSRPHEMK